LCNNIGKTFLMENSKKYLLRWILSTLFADWLRQYFNVPFPSRMSYNVNRIIRNRVHAFQFAINASSLPLRFYAIPFNFTIERASEERNKNWELFKNCEFFFFQKRETEIRIPGCIKNKSIRKLYIIEKHRFYNIWNLKKL